MPNPLDLTGGRRTVVFASKVPAHRGLSLTGGATVAPKRPDLVLERPGGGCR